VKQHSNLTLTDQPQITPDDRSFAKRWKHSILFENGYVPVPTLFLELYGRLRPTGLTSGEALFVLQLMSFKWDDHAPFPGYKRIALRMGITDKMVRRYAQNLELKGYLIREKRIGQSNRFDLTPLFDALYRAVQGMQPYRPPDSTAKSRWASPVMTRFRAR